MGKLTNVNRLKPGMILDKDVINKKTGAILISKDTAMTKPFIKKLSNYEIYAVFIKEEVIPEWLYNDDFTREYSKIEGRLDNIFSQVKARGSFDSNDIANEIRGFAKEIALERDILTQMRLLRKKDDYTFNHSLGVSILATTLGNWLGYKEDEILELALAGLFHDIGKLKISDNIMKKPARLTDEECDEMKRHSYYGYEILRENNNFSQDILRGVLDHHEKNNGSGYPNGIRGDKIHKYAKIIAVCDIYHALTSDRVYKDKDSPFKTADYLRQQSFSSLDPHITQVFLKNISRFYVGNKVLISNGATGIIIYLHPQNDTKPVVKINDQFIDFLEEQDVEIVDIII